MWLIQLKPLAICCALTVSASLALAPWPLNAKWKRIPPVTVWARLAFW